MTQATAQFILFLFMAAIVVALILLTVRHHRILMDEAEHEQSNRRVRREITQIERDRPHHILKGDQ